MNIATLDVPKKGGLLFTFEPLNASGTARFRAFRNGRGFWARSYATAPKVEFIPIPECFDPATITIRFIDDNGTEELSFQVEGEMPSSPFASKYITPQHRPLHMNYSELIASIHALVAAIDVWRQARNDRQAKARYEEVFKQTLNAPDIEARSARLMGVLPPEVAQAYEANIEQCKKAFAICIRDKFDDKALEHCEAGFRTCICSNLRSLLRTNGCIPEEFLPMWRQHGCGVIPNVC